MTVAKLIEKLKAKEAMLRACEPHAERPSDFARVYALRSEIVQLTLAVSRVTFPSQA